jgi:hypothetical protein
VRAIFFRLNSLSEALYLFDYCFAVNRLERSCKAFRITAHDGIRNSGSAGETS